MTTSDVRDVLNLPDGLTGPRLSKKQKTSAARPNLKGLAREVHQLGGDNPIAIVPEVAQFKRRRLASRKPAQPWEMRPFLNSARDDQSLILRHWRRKEAKDAREEKAQEKGTAPMESEDAMEDSTFAKFNVKVSVPEYSDEQYSQFLKNEDWTKEETDYLMDLVREYDVRWPIIWDRYEWSAPATNGEENADGDESKAIVPTTLSRAMEELKARYYEVASKMMAAQKPVQCMTQPEFALHELMSHFNPQQEKLRKDFAMNAMSRSREEAREEESLLVEIKRILARSERFNEERRELYNRLEYPRADTDISSFKSSAGLQTLLQNLLTADKSKKRKSIMGTDGVSPGVVPPSQSAAQEAARRESGATSAVSNHRDSLGAAGTPTGASRKGSQQQQQQQQQPPTPQQERRKLTTHEEALYGVTHHDRLGSGPSFRTEKINKMFSHKSNQQQLRISNALSELDVPSKLAMPTAATTLQFEHLLASVSSLLDTRKVSDKLDGEIKLEQAKKAEREKAMGPPESKKGPTAVPEKTGKSTEAGEATADAEKEAAVPTQQEAAQAKAGGDGDQQPDEPVEGGGRNEPSEGTAETEVPKEAEEDKAGGGRSGGGSTNHKRSASVLSAVSDKSAKRQKK
ncbi:SWR1-complex protein 4 [Drechmeria coniospora]|uniref:SWR1-complex protein 4 n=1 Tax=Drechmeria coniospora TaxID=98403 RepID=A0A151GTF0_DRECN|nr:SWR1-complex protein 4 [Drechmeria coniospora]KYK60350.1 SWR1-complex protein 4 [Drechmeria coniospora]